EGQSVAIQPAQQHQQRGAAQPEQRGHLEHPQLDPFGQPGQLSRGFHPQEQHVYQRADAAHGPHLGTHLRCCGAQGHPGTGVLQLDRPVGPVPEPRGGQQRQRQYQHGATRGESDCDRTTRPARRIGIGPHPPVRGHRHCTALPSPQPPTALHSVVETRTIYSTYCRVGGVITGPVLPWVFTALFLAVAAHCVVGLGVALRPVMPGRVGDRSGGGVDGRTAIAHLCHLLMSLSMVAMAWPWWSHLPATPQVVVFALAAAWFAVQTRSATTGRLRHVIDAAMMLAMVWMVAVMGYGPHATDAGMAGTMADHQHGTLAPVQVAVGLGLTV